MNILSFFLYFDIIRKLVMIMKKIVVPRNLENIDDMLFFADAFLFGVESLSVHFENTYSLEQLKSVILKLKDKGKDVFLSCNKNS